MQSDSACWSGALEGIYSGCPGTPVIDTTWHTSFVSGPSTTFDWKEFTVADVGSQNFCYCYETKDLALECTQSFTLAIKNCDYSTMATTGALTVYSGFAYTEQVGNIRNSIA
jgi:hypothetical protein